MTPEFVSGGAIGAMSVALFWILAAYSRRAHLQAERVRGSRRTFSLAFAYRSAMLGLMAAAIYAHYSLVYVLETPEPAWRLVKPIWIVASTAYVTHCLIYAFRFQVVIDERRMCIRTAFERQEISFDEIRRVAGVPGSWAFRIESPTATATISVFLVGIRELFTIIEKEASFVDIADAKETLRLLAR